MRSLEGCVYKWHNYILKGRETLNSKERLTKLIKGSIVLPKTSATSATPKLTKKTPVTKLTSSTNKMPKTRRANAMVLILSPILIPVPSSQRSQKLDKDMQLYNLNEEIALYDLVEDELDFADEHSEKELGQAFKKNQSLRPESLSSKKEVKGVLKVFTVLDEEESDEEEEISLNIKNLFEKV